MRPLFALFLYWSLLHASLAGTETGPTETVESPVAVQEAPLLIAAADADANRSVSPPAPPQRHIYTTVTAIPTHLFVGEIYPVALRTIVTVPQMTALAYRFKGGRDTTAMEGFMDRDQSGAVFHDTLYFKATGPNVKIPDLLPTIARADSDHNESIVLRGSAVDTTALNPPADFCGIVADHFAISAVKGAVYDPEHTIVVFEADANRSDLNDFRIPSAVKQGFEFIEVTPRVSRMHYFAIFPANLHRLDLSYFNLKSRRYERVHLPIVPEDDSVSTMSDLAPKAHGHIQVKTAVALVVGILFLTLFYYQRAKTYLLFALIAFGLAAWLGAPIRHVCLKKGSEIYLLPMPNATVFERTDAQQSLEMAGGIENYTKVRLPDNKIGWIKDEALCTP